MTIAALITARGGSKGLPRKNVLSLGDKPLIAHSILAAKGCAKVARCLVTTEDPEIKRVSLEWGAEVIDRPSELAGDQALSRDVVRHALDWLETHGGLPDYFALLQPTSPLRTAAHLTACIEKFASSGAASAVSVTESEPHPYKAFAANGGTLKPLFGSQYLDQPRQKLPLCYAQNGAIYIVPSRRFLETGTFYIEPVMPFIMPRQESVDIEDAVDLEVAAQFLRRSS